MATTGVNWCEKARHENSRIRTWGPGEGGGGGRRGVNKVVRASEIPLVGHPFSM